MRNRIVVTVSDEAKSRLDSVAAMLADKTDMRVGFTMPGLSALVGEVAGDIEVDRIRTMHDVAGVRVMEQVQGKGRRAAARA